MENIQETENSAFASDKEAFEAFGGRTSGGTTGAQITLYTN